MKNPVRIFQTPYEAVEALANWLEGKIKEAAEERKPYTVALSGGKTPELLFSVLGDHFSRTVPWNRVHFFWGDERCVPPDDKDSNYGMARKKLFDKIRIPVENIHRMRGEDDSSREAERYSDEISKYTAKRNDIPMFDLILLGLGEDGHTASIFPGQEHLFVSEKICEATTHPVTNQKRITLTGKVINNAENVIFLVTGGSKSEVIKKIVEGSPQSGNLPASFIKPEYGDLQWFIDKEAGRLLHTEDTF